MTKEEAIRILRYEKPAKEYVGNLTEALDKAIEALEKQIPKPVQYETDYTWGIKDQTPVCPVCDMYVTKIVFLPVEGHEDAPRISYCESCGQAIDWKGGE